MASPDAVSSSRDTLTDRERVRVIIRLRRGRVMVRYVKNHKIQSIISVRMQHVKLYFALGYYNSKLFVRQTLCPFPSLTFVWTELVSTVRLLRIEPTGNAGASKWQHDRRTTVEGYSDHDPCYLSYFVLCIIYHLKKLIFNNCIRETVIWIQYFLMI